MRTKFLFRRHARRSLATNHPAKRLCRQWEANTLQSFVNRCTSTYSGFCSVRCLAKYWRSTQQICPFRQNKGQNWDGRFRFKSAPASVQKHHEPACMQLMSIRSNVTQMLNFRMASPTNTKSAKIFQFFSFRLKVRPRLCRCNCLRRRSQTPAPCPAEATVQCAAVSRSVLSFPRIIRQCQIKAPLPFLIPFLSRPTEMPVDRQGTRNAEARLRICDSRIHPLRRETHVSLTRTGGLSLLYARKFGFDHCLLALPETETGTKNHFSLPSQASFLQNAIKTILF